MLPGASWSPLPSVPPCLGQPLAWAAGSAASPAGAGWPTPSPLLWCQTGSLYLGAAEEQPMVCRGRGSVGRRRGGFLAEVKSGRACGGQSEAPLMGLGRLGQAKCPHL